MIVDIVSNINPEKLDYAIKQIGKKDIAYIVMSSKTKHDLAVNNVDVISWLSGDNDSSYATYKAIPIAIYEGLRYGEVDIVGIKS